MISRKTLLKTLALGTVSLPVVLRTILGSERSAAQNGPAVSGRRYEWKMVTTWPPGFPVLGEGCQLLADLIRRMSGGRLDIRVYGGGELVPALEAFDAVRNGSAQMGSGSAKSDTRATPKSTKAANSMGVSPKTCGLVAMLSISCSVIASF